MHNHPSGLIFSEGDLRSFYEQENLKILGAVGNEGSTYFVVKAKNYDDFGFYDFLDETRKSYNIKMNEEEHLNFIQKIVEGADEYGVKFYITKN